MCTAGVYEARDKVVDDTRSSAKEYARRMEAEKGRIEDTNISGKAMEQFEGGVRNLDSMGRVIGDELGRWGDAASSLMGMGKPQNQDSTVSDTASANYSKSSSEKSSQSKSKAKKKSGEGTGGSKAQFYAKK
jgi:hypothetical protein